MNAIEQAQQRNEAARRIREYHEEIAAMQRKDEQRKAEAKREEKVVARRRKETVEKKVFAAELNLAELLATDEAQEILGRLSDALCEFNAVDFDVEQHIANVAVDAIQAKRNPRNHFARRTA